MLLKVMYYRQKDGKYAAVTRYEGHVKAWFSDSLVNLKKKAGSWLGRAHRDGVMDGISQMKFFEGYPNDNTVWLLDEPTRRKYRRRVVIKNEPIKAPTQAKVDDDNTTYLYKEEGGYLKIYSKTLVMSFPIAKSVQF